MRASTRIPTLRAAVAAVLLATACAPDGDDRNVGARLIPRVAVEDLRIDGHASDLVPIGDLAVGPDGAIAITQSQDNNVRVFAPDGTLHATVGRAGSGPGEFQFISRVGWLGDTLWVVDPAQQRISFFGPDLAFVRSIQTPVARPAPADSARLPDFPFVLPIGVYPDGDLLATVMTAAGQVHSSFDASTTPLARVSPDGIVRRLVARIPPNPGSIRVENETGIFTMQTPFFASPHFDGAPDASRIGFVTTDVDGSNAGTFHVWVIGSEGDTLVSRRFPFTGVPIPGSVADSVKELRASRAQIPAMQRAIRELELPPVYAPVEGILMGRDHSIWIQLRAVEDMRPWLVLDAQGAILDTIRLARNVRIRVADQQTVWATATDEVDVQSVVRYRLERGDPAPAP